MRGFGYSLIKSNLVSFQLHQLFFSSRKSLILGLTFPMIAKWLLAVVGITSNSTLSK